MKLPVIAVHGGAGNVLPTLVSNAVQKEAHHVLSQAMEDGRGCMLQGGTATEAVVAAVTVLENHPLFNAGYGAVLNVDGLPEMDACVMCGQSLESGAVAGVQRVRNPVQLAYNILCHSDHAVLLGAGAESFAQAQGIPLIDPKTLIYPARQDQYEWYKAQTSRAAESFFPDEFESYKFGTVGAVAVDMKGHVAAATSTGGMLYKKYGRVGDSPLVGSGTYANNKGVAVSCTGQGEYFIKNMMAYNLYARIYYQQISLIDAAAQLMEELLPAQGGHGGFISVNREGEVFLGFNTAGMYRGFWNETGKHTALFKND